VLVLLAIAVKIQCLQSLLIWLQAHISCGHLSLLSIIPLPAIIHPLWKFYWPSTQIKYFQLRNPEDDSENWLTPGNLAKILWEREYT
jgi:hypothetical protein